MSDSCVILISEGSQGIGEIYRMGVGGSKEVIKSGLKHCTLWKADRSPPCRAVMMALDAMNLSITEVDVNIDKGEHKTPELTAYNSLQTLPIFKDRDLVLHDSHAIMTYLARRYCDTGRFLPKDQGGRALTDQLLHFNSGILYPRYEAAINPVLYENCSFLLPQQYCDIQRAYRDLEGLLEAKTWFMGSMPGLADISIAATVSTLNILVPVDETKYPRLSSWLSRMSEELYYITANKKGLAEFARRIDRGRVSDDDYVFKCPRSSTRRRESVPDSSEFHIKSELP